MKYEPIRYLLVKKIIKFVAAFLLNKLNYLMLDSKNNYSKNSSFRIVLIYAIISIVYVYASDYILKTIITDIHLISKVQTYKGIGFIIITASLLYIIVKKNLDTITFYYQQLLEVQQSTEDKLESSHEEYMSLFNHSPLPKWIFDLENFKFLLVNEVACSLYGYTLEEYQSMTLLDIRPIEDRPELEQTIAASFENGHFEIPSVVRHLKKNGDIIYVKVKNTIVTYKGKKVRLASAVDVTAEINAHNELLEINSKLKLASEIASMGYWTNDLKQSKIEWSDEVYKIFELDPQNFELTLESIKSRFHPDYQNRFDFSMYSNFEDHTIKEFEYKIIAGSGQVKWLLEKLYIIKDVNNTPTKLAGIVLDITKRKLYEQEILQSNERFKMLARATVEAIIDWDIVNHTVMWGEGFHTMLGYDIDNTDKHLWSKNIHPDDQNMVLDDLKNALEDPSKEFFNADFRFIKANGDVAFMQHRGIFIRDVNGKAIRALGAMIDLTETLDRMHKIELQNKALREIAWTQSHIVRAPLTNLMGFISLFKENLKTNSIDDKLCDYIISSSNKLDQVIHDIVKKANETEEN